MNLPLPPSGSGGRRLLAVACGVVVLSALAAPAGAEPGKERAVEHGHVVFSDAGTHTWTRPEGVENATVYLWGGSAGGAGGGGGGGGGGGAGGGGGGGAGGAGAGGGAGAFVECHLGRYQLLTVPRNLSVVVGGAGAGGAGGAAGAGGPLGSLTSPSVPATAGTAGTGGTGGGDSRFIATSTVFGPNPADLARAGGGTGGGAPGGGGLGQRGNKAGTNPIDDPFGDTLGGDGRPGAGGHGGTPGGGGDTYCLPKNPPPVLTGGGNGTPGTAGAAGGTGEFTSGGDGGAAGTAGAGGTSPAVSSVTLADGTVFTVPANVRAGGGPGGSGGRGGAGSSGSSVYRNTQNERTLVAARPGVNGAPGSHGGSGSPGLVIVSW
ncbi:hypothetical protein [Streptomyces clavuligerus]|nr:hypothetical protein [Streptomyces clavuligerus]ANW17182.1 hypothetical protein BB341_02580 [Streptomyces clavuligerus]QCS04500.1 hypothetical protein CRV15_02120 [Streptomyces clavuligerus]